jgi:hypothetical protein
MQTHELSPAQWIPALDELSAAHEGWLVSVDVLSSEIGAQHEIESLPLLGVSADRSDRGTTVTIAAGRPPGERVTRVIGDVSRVYVGRTDQGADAALEIESADGTRTILRFRVPVLPERVDGVARA